MAWKRGFIAALVLAVPAAPLAGGIGVTPAYLDVRLDKGRPAGKFIISNPSKTEERYRVKMIHFELLENGGLRRIPPNSNSLAPWMKFNPKELVIPARSKRSVRFVIVPRGKLRPGEYWAAMELESLKASIRTGRDTGGREFKVEVIPTILVPVFGQVGKVRHSGVVTSTRLIQDKTGPALEMVVTNTGTGRLLLGGNYTVTDASGKKLAEGPCGHGYVMPRARRLFKSPLKATLAAGTYTLNVRLSAAQLKNVVLSDERRVTYTPPPPQKEADPKDKLTGGSDRAAPKGGSSATSSDKEAGTDTASKDR